MDYLIRNATIVNEGSLREASIYISDGKIVEIFSPDKQPQIPASASYETIDATECLLLPGIIDTHVHFRDPGMTEKADFATESRAAAAGGVTSVIDMPNTIPQTTTLPLLEQKEKMAAEKSVVNYGFMLGATNDNIDELISIDTQRYAAIKLFLGSSTGNMLVNDAMRLDHLFQHSRKIIVAHCEEESIVQANMKLYKAEFAGTDKERAALHPKIRNTEACYVSTYKAIERALKYGTRLHIAHVSSATELNMLSNKLLVEKRITAEVTPNHLWYDDRDYAELGNLIKCNPSIKSNNDRLALWAALYDGLLDTIGSDHAPHTWDSKQKNYFDAPSGIPSIQHTLQMMLEACYSPISDHAELIDTWVPLIVEKMCHNPAVLFGIKKRGFIRKGYYADLTLVRTGVEQTINKDNILYKCGWSPLEGQTFHTRIEKTFVNGNVAFDAAAMEHSFKHKGSLLEFSA